MKILARLYDDESGFIVSAELILLASILVLGMIVGLTVLRDTITTELADTATAFGQINQSFSFSGATGHGSSIAGSLFSDAADFGDNTSSSSSGTGTAGLTFVPASSEIDTGS
jgi:hypothetical protein